MLKLESKLPKILAVVAFFLLGIAMIVYGIGLQDVEEVIANGTTLCLSCIGIG